MSDASNCPYSTGGFDNISLSYPHLDRGDGAVAHLLSTGALTNVFHQSRYNVSSLANDIGLHEWINGVRFIGVRGSGSIEKIQSLIPQLKSYEGQYVSATYSGEPNIGTKRI